MRTYRAGREGVLHHGAGFRQVVQVGRDDLGVAITGQRPLRVVITEENDNIRRHDPPRAAPPLLSR